MYDSRDRWFTSEVDLPEVDDAGWTDEERVSMQDPRWWSVEELRSTTDRTVAADLVDVVAQVPEPGLPAEPLQLRV